MSISDIVFVVMAVVLLTIALIWAAVPPFMKLAKKKGWNIPGIIQKINSWLSPMDNLADVLVNLNIPGATIFDKIIHAAREAVGYAEQITKNGEIAPEQRYDKAMDAIATGLKLAGLTDDQIKDTNVQTIIQVCLQSAVNNLGHKETPISEKIIQGFNETAAKAAIEQIE